METARTHTLQRRRLASAWIAVALCLVLALTGSLGCQNKSMNAQVPSVSAFADWGSNDPPMPSFPALLVSKLKSLLGHSKQVDAPVALPKPVASRHKAMRQQAPLTLPANAVTFATKLATHFGRGRAFRVLVQSDKPLYKRGETIWVRAVAIRSKGNQPRSERGRSLYRLVSPRGAAIIAHHVPTYHGHSHHAFKLPSNAAGGVYKIEISYPYEKAKTTHRVVVAVYQPPRLKKKLVFLRKGYDGGDTIEATLTVKRAAGKALANQEVLVVARLGGKVLKQWKAHTNSTGELLLRTKLPKALRAKEGSLTVRINDAGATESISRPIPLRNKTLKVGFFPEGGQAIVGQPARVYFAARQPNQKPQDIEGTIRDNLGKVVAQVRSFHDGMGRFLYTPQKGKRYTLHLRKPQGIKGTFSLPKAQASGVALQWTDDFAAKEKSLSMIVSTPGSRKVIVTALQHETLIGQRAFQLKPGSQVLKLPLQKQWRGIVRLTIFGADHKPLAERLVFRRRGKGLRFKVTTHRKRYQPRSTVEVKVKVTTPDGKPLSGARLGVAVVDDTVLSYADDHEPTWLAQRFLTQQLTGKIHKPNFYFATNERKALRGLDLVMGTHGWRAFDWRVVKRGKAPVKKKPKLSNPPREFDRLVWTRTITKRTPGPAPRVRTRRKVDTRAARNKRLAQIIHEKILRNFSFVLIPGRGQGGGIISAKGFGSEGSNALDGWSGAKVGNAIGGGGLGLKGSGAGGGGFSGSTLGLGRVGTLGGGSRSGWGSGRSRGLSYGYGGGKGGLWPGRSRLRGRKGRRVRIKMGRVVLRGSLSKAVIARVVRRKRRSIRYCYERELIKNPNLKGTITVRWVINRAGRVQVASVAKDSMRNSRVASCVRMRVLRWRFPQPAGGGLVIVKYPFHFRSSPGSRSSRRGRLGRYIAWHYPRRFPIWFYTEKARANAARSDFRETVYWHPHLRTDAWGETRFSFGLSDNITSFRLTLTGVGGGSIGTHKHMIQSTRPFFLAAKVPLEVSGGDAMVIPLSLRNDGTKKLKLKVTSTLSQEFKLTENPLPNQVELLPGQARTYFYPIRVLARQGKGQVTFKASGKGFRDTLTRSISIQARGYPRTLRWSATLRPSKRKTLSIPLPKAIVGLHSRMVLALSSTERMERALASILREPYGCFEQTSSANYPNIMALQYLKQKGKVSPRFAQRAHRMLAKGYKRLVQFETSTGGFSLYGRVPGNEAITAYGLLQFRDLQAAHGGVDREMVARVTRWLLSRRDGLGGFEHGKGSGGTFGRASRQVANAYITYVLTALGHKGLQREQDTVVRMALVKPEAYTLALALHMQSLRSARKHPQVLTLQKSLLSLQRKDGSFRGAASIVNAGGRNLYIETTGLAIQALLASGGEQAPIRRAVAWLRTTQRFSGGYGTTQATVQALRALVQWDVRFPTPARKKLATLRIEHNGKQQPVYTIGRKRSQTSVLTTLAKVLRPGANKLAFQLTGAKPLPISLALLYNTYQPVSSPGVAVTMTTKLQKKKAKMGELIRLTATIENTTTKKLPTTMVRIAYPGAFTIQPWQLKALKVSAKADLVETRAREVILYYQTFPPRAKKTVHLDLIARVTGNYTSGPSSAYLYYADDKKHWAAPLKISVAP